MAKKKPLPDLPCPSCSSADTVPLRNYGRPIAGEVPGTSTWWCLHCHHRFDGPEVRR
jgi:C4-type Zn-finger protein